MSIRLSQLDSKVRILTEQVALNEEKVEQEKLICNTTASML